jgi:hypothetical protein
MEATGLTEGDIVGPDQVNPAGDRMGSLLGPAMMKDIVNTMLRHGQQEYSFNVTYTGNVASNNNMWWPANTFYNSLVRLPRPMVDKVMNVQTSPTAGEFGMEPEWETHTEAATGNLYDIWKPTKPQLLYGSEKYKQMQSLLWTVSLTTNCSNLNMSVFGSVIQDWYKPINTPRMTIAFAVKQTAQGGPRWGGSLVWTSLPCGGLPAMIMRSAGNRAAHIALYASRRFLIDKTNRCYSVTAWGKSYALNVPLADSEGVDMQQFTAALGLGDFRN